MEAKIYNIEGQEAGKITLPAAFETKWNADLVHQVVTSMQTNSRTPVAHTKTRGEVRGGGKKPWQQKGTGRARHGSTRSPIWVGGGVAHGPRNDKNFSRKINKKMKAKAVLTILSRKFRDGEILFVDNISLNSPKTKEAKTILGSLSKIKGYELISKKRKNAALIVGTPSEATRKSFRNIGNVTLGGVSGINPVSLMTYKYVVITNPEESIKIFSKDNK